MKGMHQTDLFILAGQSNMEGMGRISELPDTLQTPMEEVPIYHPSRKRDGEPVEQAGGWAPLRPGHGYGHRVEQTPDGKDRICLSDRFGPELTFARTWLTLRPGRRIALFKYARGGSSLHANTPDDWGTWDPDFEGMNQWTHLRTHLDRACRQYENRTRRTLRPAALVWVQGESDAAYTREIAEAYHENLHALIDRFRTQVGVRNLPVVIGQISAEGRVGGEPALPWAATVRQAQHDLAVSDSGIELVPPPPETGWQDPWHYDSRTYLALGSALAEGAARLIPTA